MTADTKLMPCPFCKAEMYISSNRDWHKLYGPHGPECVFEPEEPQLVFAATDQGKESIIAIWNTRPTPSRAASSAEVGAATKRLEDAAETMDTFGGKNIFREPFQVNAEQFSKDIRTLIRAINQDGRE